MKRPVRSPRLRGEASAALKAAPPAFPSAAAIVAAIFLILAACSQRPADGGAPPRDRETTVVLRIDDVSPVSNTALETGLIEILREQEVPCVFGVIPFAPPDATGPSRPTEPRGFNSDKAGLLAAAAREGVVEIAQHGYDHVSHRKSWYQHDSEFSGLSREVQLGKIARGKGYLETVLGTTVATFIPPFNRYDKTTLQLLGELGFRTLSAGGYYNTDWDASIKCLPATCSLFELEKAVEAARSVPGPNPIVVGLFHEYDFGNANEDSGLLTLERFREIVVWLKSRPEVRVRTLDQTVAAPGDWSVRRYQAYASCNMISYLLPRFVRARIFPGGVWLATDLATAWSYRLVAVALFFWMAMCALGFWLLLAAVRLLGPSRIVSHRACWIGSPPILLLVGLVAQYDPRNISLALAGLSFWIGVCAGIVYSRFRPPRQGRAGKGGRDLGSLRTA